MAFKRVADDFDDFNIHRKRRVNDLLLDNIPSDEATLLANGKLVCLVCHHKPVFDTTAVLTIHRNGKKHLSNVLIKLERAKEDADIRQRREHEQYLKSSSIEAESPLIGQTKLSKNLALNSIPHGPSPGNRCSINSTQPCGSGIITSNVVYNTSSNSFFKAKTDKEMPYQCKNSKLSSTNLKHVGKEANLQTFLSIPDNKKQSTNDYNYLGIKKKSAKQRFLSVNPLTQRKIQPEVEQEVKASIEDEDNSLASLTQKEPSNYDKLDQNSKALYLSRLRQIGWVLGLNGEWQKDENAEFDSDEDQPPSPKTILKQ